MLRSFSRPKHISRENYDLSIASCRRFGCCELEIFKLGILLLKSVTDGNRLGLYNSYIGRPDITRTGGLRIQYKLGIRPVDLSARPNWQIRSKWPCAVSRELLCAFQSVLRARRPMFRNQLDDGFVCRYKFSALKQKTKTKKTTPRLYMHKEPVDMASTSQAAIQQRALHKFTHYIRQLISWRTPISLLCCSTGKQ